MDVGGGIGGGKGRVHEITDNEFLHDSGKNGRIGDGAVVGAGLGFGDFGNRYNGRFKPLSGKYGRRNGSTVNMG